MAKITFWEIIEKTIEKVGKPLSAREIWDKANEIGTIGDFETTGKTPWATIAAYCHTDINNNSDEAMIIHTNTRPAQFFLKKLESQIDLNKVQKEKDAEIVKKEIAETKKKFNERDLHPILVSFAYADTHFKANLKTIFHENSSKTTKGQNE